MRLRRVLASVVAVATALTLTACAGMPMSGEVRAGRDSSVVDESVDIAFQPAGPQKDATPQQIVEGFIAAATSPENDWETAKLFLSPAMREKWVPTAGVTVDELVDRQWDVAGDASITLTVSPEAEVDERGAYTESDAGPLKLPFELAEQADGQWRITSATDGIVLDRDLFARVFRPYSLMFFDPSWNYLVPDLRWFPTRTNTAFRIVQELIDGTPSPWLAGAAVTAFPDEMNAPGSVPVTEDGVARVEVPAMALALPAVQLERMQAQLDASLASANVTDAVMSIGSVDIDATPVEVRSTRIDARPAVLTKDGFGFLASSELQPIPGISKGMAQVSPLDIALGVNRDVAALRLRTGEVVRMVDDGTYGVIDSRAGLIAPTIDPFDYVWSVPAAKPGGLVAFASDGSSKNIGDAWAGAVRITSMQISRDGTRMVALVDTGGRAEAWIAGVIRDRGAPVRLGQAVRLAALPGSGVDVAWLDDDTVGIVSAVGTQTVVLSQQIGGLRTTTTPTTTARVVSISGGSQFTSVRLRAEDDTMYLKSGTRWQQTATGILVLATQQGSPQ